MARSIPTSRLLLVLVAFAAPLGAERSRYGSWSPDGGTIVFEREIDGDFELFTMGVDDAHLRRLTHTAGRDGLPRFSPDGQRILFVSERDGEARLFIMDRDGTGVRPLPRGDGFADGSAWSPRGDWIVFDSGVRGSGIRHLYRVRPAGSQLEKLVRGDHAAFSPDGGRLAYSHGEPGGLLGIYRLDLATGASRRISRDRDPDFIVDWSPDGRLLAVCSSRDHAGQATEIYLMHPDGTDQRRLTVGDQDDCAPRFSPDGARILFTSWRDGSEAIYVMDLDGSDQVRLAPPPDAR